MKKEELSVFVTVREVLKIYKYRIYKPQTTKTIYIHIYCWDFSC